MALSKIPAIRTPISEDGVWIVPVSRVLRLGCLMQACRNPHCTCTEVDLYVYELDERVSEFGRKKGKLMLQCRSLDDQPLAVERAMALRLDVYSGVLLDQERHPVDTSSDRRLAALEDSLDGQTLDALEKFRRREKGLERSGEKPRAEVGLFQPGELARWDEIFQVDRPELFVDSEKTVIGLDHYCINPACDCRSVRVVFAELLDSEKSTALAIGSVTVHFDGKVEFEPEESTDESRLRSLWARYRRRHPEMRMQFERYGRIREVGVRYLASSSARQGSAGPSLLLPGMATSSPGAGEPASKDIAGADPDAADPVPAADSLPAASPSRPHLWSPTSRKRKERTRKR